MSKRFSIGEAIKFGYQKFIDNWPLLVGVFLFTGLIYGIESMISSQLKDDYPLYSNLVAALGYVLNLLFSVGLTIISLKLSRNETPTFKDLFTGGRYVFFYFIATLCYWIVAVVGLLLLVVPGLIWMVRYALYPFFIIDKGQGPLEAMASSANATYGAKWDYFGFFVLSALINLLGAIALLAGLLITLPITMIANAYIYRKLLAQTQTSEIS